MKNNFLIQFDILLPNYSEGGYFLKMKLISALTIIKKKQLKLKNSFQNSFKSCKISTFNFRFLGSVILHMLSITAYSEEHNFGLVSPRQINNISYES